VFRISIDIFHPAAGNYNMCGLTVLISRNLSLDVLINATRLIRHRGPDDEGFLLANKNSANWFAGQESNRRTLNNAPGIENISNSDCLVGLGHRRLAIIDTTIAGCQPMTDRSRRVWIVFNGEIYNYRELATELQKNFEFRTQTDTEILLAAYLQWGEAMLNHLNGMFAFVIYDHQKQNLFFARDRFGIKPLYFWCSSQGDWLVASEIKQFSAHPEWKPSVNGQSAYDYLNWGLIDHSSETMFKDVYQLSPGNMLSIKINNLLRLSSFEQLPIHQWYSLKPQEVDGELKETTARFKTILEDSIRLRLRSDVPVGSCLSGGLDSSSIVCLVSRILQGRGEQKTFTACSLEKRFDERHWAEMVSKHAKTDAKYTYPELIDLLKFTPKITWHQDEPFGSTSIYAQWRVFALASQHKVKVMLDGQGADEQLAGYHDFLWIYLAELATKGDLTNWWIETNAIKKLHGYGRGLALAATLGYSLPGNLRQYIHKYLGKTSKYPPVKPVALIFEPLKAVC
jgi:asparagine synthase (glutamine-hydrolysing)